jgi:CHAP domain
MRIKHQISGRLVRRGSVVAGVMGLLGVALVGPGVGAAFAASDGYEIAFQANNGTLYSYTSALVGTSTTLGMESGTGPASVQLSDGTFESAFEANNNDLYIHKWTGANTSTTLGMAPGTSPALAALPTSAGWVAAFEANNDDLYIYTSAGTSTNTKLGMKAGTSPAIAVQPNGKWDVAFQTNDGVLDTYDSVGNSQVTTDGMAAGTSPSITPLSDGSYEVAFEANNDNLSAYHTGGSTDNTNLGMDAGTNPSITTEADGAKWEVAFESNAHTLYTYDSVGNNQGTSDGMAPGTRPSITPEPDNSYEVAFEANNDNLGIYHTGGTTTATSLGMSAGTSPTAAISAPSATSSVAAHLTALANANVGKGAGYCSQVNASDNTLGGDQFLTSCSGNGGAGEYWCADFASWVWQNVGINTAGITPAASSFITDASDNGSTVHTSSSYAPQVGDVLVYDYSGGVASHDGLVVAVNSNGSITTDNGDFGGVSNEGEAEFAQTSSVMQVTIASTQKYVGDTPTGIGMTISAAVTPSGLG